jgi:putative transposase
LLGLARSSWYYEPAPESPENLELMRRIDEQYTKCPFYGSRRITAWLRSRGQAANRKRVQRLLRVMGLEAIYPKPNLSAGRGHKVYPYLLRDVAVERVDQVWSADITYIPLPSGFMYLAATIDWFSRYVIAWRLSNTLDGAFCQEMRGRCLDNVFVERLWRTVKYEDVYLKGYERVPELECGLRAYFGFYNRERLHQSLDYRTPAEVYGVGATTA